MSELILATKSPRRISLLKNITNDFIVVPSEFDESTVTDKKPKKLVSILAAKKAEIIFNKHGGTVIGADTIVYANNKILGIPKSKDEARNMLIALSGKSHYVYTGVAIIKNGTINVFVSKTKVCFYKLQNEEIEKYINGTEPYDKAGGYGIQGEACLFIKKIKGDYNCILGLPVSKLKKQLEINKK